MSNAGLTPAALSGPADSALQMGAIFNLSKATVMVVDDNPYSLKLTAQTLLGFGMKGRTLCQTADQARQFLQHNVVDLMIVDCDMPDEDGYDLVRWLRRSGMDPNAFTPVLMISGHIRRTMVAKARDCGANFMVTRPLTPSVLLERILWLAKDPRAFIQAGDYLGPDRRFNDPNLPPGQIERRADRLKAIAAEAEAAAPASGEGKS